MSESKLIATILGALNLALLVWALGLLSADVLGLLIGFSGPLAIIFTVIFLLILSFTTAAMRQALIIMTTTCSDASPTLLRGLQKLSLVTLSLYPVLVILQQLLYVNALAY